MNIIFLGTPEFSVRILDAIFNSDNKIVAVVTQIDKINGRKNKIEFSPVKKYAIEHNLKLFQFENISSDGFDILSNLKPDLMITAAYGQLIKQNILDICPIFNVHTSLLPKLRGASPVQTALINGDTETGVTIMKTELKMDAGDIILQEKINIERNIDAGTLLLELSNVASRLILKAINSYADGSIKYTKQNEEEATFCKYINKSDSFIDFNCDGKSIYNKVRGMNPNPGTYFLLENLRIKVLKCEFIQSDETIINRVEYADKINGFCIGCKDGYIKLINIKPEGKNEMSGFQYLSGNKKITQGILINEL